MTVHRPGVDEGLSEPPQASRYTRSVDQEQGSIPGGSAGSGSSSNNRTNVVTSRTTTTAPVAIMSPTTAAAQPKGTRGGALTGQPLYETNGKEKTLCGMISKQVDVQFYPQAVVVRTRSKTCCFPSSKGMNIIPRYKITDIETGSGARSIPCWVYLVLSVSILLILFGSFSQECGIVRIDGTSVQDCDLTGGGIAMIIFGILLFACSIVLFVHYCQSKDSWYTLVYSIGRSNYSFLSSSSAIQLECENKPDEQFLYRYVYDTIEQTIDLPFLHRFNHLNRAGLMEATHEKNTPDELRTLLDVPFGGNGNNNGGTYPPLQSSSGGVPKKNNNNNHRGVGNKTITTTERTAPDYSSRTETSHSGGMEVEMAF